MAIRETRTAPAQPKAVDASRPQDPAHRSGVCTAFMDRDGVALAMASCCEPCGTSKQMTTQAHQAYTYEAELLLTGHKQVMKVVLAVRW